MSMYAYVSSIDSYYHIMRPSQRKQLQRHRQEEESYSFIDDQSIRLHDPQRLSHPASQSNATSHRNNYRFKKKDFLSILDDRKGNVAGREDYNSRNQPIPPTNQQDREGWKWKKARFEQEKQKLDEELLRYQRSGETTTKKQQSGRSSREVLRTEPIYLQEVVDNDEQDLSFTELHPQQTLKRQNIKEVSLQEQQQQSSDWLQPVESRKKEEIKPEMKEEIKLERKVEDKPARKQQQKMQSQQNKEAVMYTVSPDKEDMRQKQKEMVGMEDSGTTTMNKGFNNISKEQSSNSSCWLEEKLLESLLQLPPDSSLSGSSESFISNIDHTRHPSEHSESLSLREEERVESVLQEIDSSLELQEKDLLLSVVFVRNIQEVIVKEVWVGRLGISLSLAMSGEDTIIKRSPVEVSRLSNYISFYQTRVIHTFNESVRQLRLCRLRVPQREKRGKQESGFIKKRREGEETELEADLARVVRVEVRCAGCGKASEVPVIQSTREASLSCTNCGEQMIARIDSLGLQ